MSMWIISRGVVLLILLMEYKVLRDFLLHLSSINSSARLSNKFGGFYFTFKFGISSLLHQVITTIADRIGDNDTSQSKQNLQSSSMTFIHKTLIILSVLDSCFNSSTVCEVKRIELIVNQHINVPGFLGFSTTVPAVRGRKTPVPQDLWLESRNTACIPGKVKSASSLALGPGGLDIAQSFFKPIHGASKPSTTSRNTKLSVIGVRNTRSVVRCLTLKHATTFLSLITIFALVDYLSTTGSDLVILTVGARHLPREYRFNLVQRNLALFSKIISPLSAASPEAILLIVSNPVDVLTYVAWKLSGLPANRVINSGTNLDCSRFWFLIADHLDVNAQDVQEKQTLEKIHKEVVQGAHEVIGLKGYTSWSIGYYVANLARTILRYKHRVHPVSVLTKGLYGIGEDVFISLPTQLGRNRALGVTNLLLSEVEFNNFKNRLRPF
ncbi:L-lactate dehydrogenase B-like protein [Tanacetum coccineum]